MRALLDNGATDPSQVTRDYSLELDTADGQAPLLSIIGGKITTYRQACREGDGPARAVFRWVRSGVDR